MDDWELAKLDNLNLLKKLMTIKDHMELSIINSKKAFNEEMEKMVENKKIEVSEQLNLLVKKYFKEEFKGKLFPANT